MCRAEIAIPASAVIAASTPYTRSPVRPGPCSAAIKHTTLSAITATRWKMHNGQGDNPSTCSAYSAYAINPAHARNPKPLPHRPPMMRMRDVRSGSRRRRALRTRLYVLLDIFHREMADVLSVRHVHDILAHVLRVIADPLERARDPQHIERATDRARILHHERDALPLDRLVLFVDEPILLRNGDCRFGIEACESV